MEAKRREREGLRFLGLARRAGAVAPGIASARQAVRDGRAKLLVVASDAAAGQMKKIERTLSDRPIPREVLGDRATLGAALGLGPVSAAAITVGSFVDGFRRSMAPVDTHDVTASTGEAED